MLALVAAALTTAAAAPALQADTIRIAVAPAETLQVVASGRGPAVVLIPGLFGGAYGYRRIGPDLARAGFHAIIVEPLGTGGSSRPRRADYSLTAQARRVAAVLDSLGVSGAVVAAHAVSSSTALRLGLERPDLVSAIVSIEGGAAERAGSGILRRADDFLPWIRMFGGASLIRRKLAGAMRKSSRDTTWISDTLVAAYTADAATDLDGTLLAYSAISRSREPYKLADRLAELRMPVLLLRGGAPHDGAPPEREVERMQERIPDFTVTTIADAGHYLHEERPELVTEAIVRAGRVQPLGAR